VGETCTDESEVHETYHQTRESTTDYVLKRLLHHVALRRRVLVGFDFPYGYPKGLGFAFASADACAPWRLIWTEVSSRLKDSDRNLNNRFDVATELNQYITQSGSGPFWGCPKDRANRHLHTHAPGYPFSTARGVRLNRFRLCEQRLRGVQEAWGLFGKGRVGSQALTGIPRVNYLWSHPRIAQISRVWPFETGFTAKPTPLGGPFILHAEIWPGIVKQRVIEIIRGNPLIIGDQAQVRAMCQWAKLLDQENAFGLLFDTPTRLDDAQARSCVDEEGWILGA
jgi:hypothetical protein